MNGIYVVAENAFTVSVSDGLAAWEALQPRFQPFAVESAAEPVLDIDIKSGPLPVCDGERIYTPEYDGIGFIMARASRLADGCMVMEFKNNTERKSRVWMKMTPALNRADIVLASGDDASAHYFLTHAMMIAFMIATCRTGTLLIHASALIYGGRAYLFQGKSGTGKSTHAALWIENISGAELLNDDNPVISFSADGSTAMAYGSPWSGKTHCYRNLSAPVGAFVRIVRDTENALLRLAPLTAYASLTASVFYLPFLSEALRDIRHRTIERVAGMVPCCEMHCRPDANAALVCKRGLSSLYE